jgi:endonuclease/exonuclease/phosphatase family metal-dependent hydrolase
MKQISFSLLFPLFLYSLDFTVASYNIENLFDFSYSGDEYQEYIPHTHNWTKKNFNKKLLNSSEVICDINADIIGLQEVENKRVLKLLQEKLRSIGCIYEYSVVTHKSKSAIQVGLLSKYPIQASKEIVVDKKRGYRNILEVKFILDSSPIVIYVNHWKSKASPESYRILSAKVLKRRVTSLPKGSEYILLGDFNSDYNEYLHISKKHDDSLGKTGINHILKTINSKGKFNRPHSVNSSFSHYNLWLELENYKRWSHNFYGDKQALDALLLPSTLFDGKGIDYIADSFKVLKKNYLFHKKGYIFRWEYNKGKHKGRGYSDHLPIVAGFSTLKRYNKINSFVSKASIPELFSTTPHFPLLLKRVKVISKKRKKVSIFQMSSNSSISIYGVKRGLRLGCLYDIVVYKRKLYNGSYEIIDFEIEKSYDCKESK